MSDQQFCMKTWRNAMGWTQQKTAYELGYKRPSTIAQLELGHISPSHRLILACKYLENRNRVA
jgi:transcriptional regulator with XRE-family HTH domain